MQQSGMRVRSTPDYAWPQILPVMFDGGPHSYHMAISGGPGKNEEVLVGHLNKGILKERDDDAGL